MTSRTNGARPGFTLVELMAVVVLIGILFAISFQSFSNAKDRSANSQVDGNIRVIAQALIAYESDNEKFPQNLTRVPAAGPGTANPNELVLLDPVLDRRYLPGNRMPRTPWSDAWQGNNLDVPNVYNAAQGIWPINHPNTVTDTVKVPPVPTPIVNTGIIPRGSQAILFTTGHFGAVMYEAMPGTRDKYMLVGLGKQRGSTAVVAISTNAN